MPHELIAVIEPEGKFLFDLEETGSAAEDPEVSHKIYNRYLEDPSSALLYLGFLPEDSGLPESINFFREISREFIKALSRTADIESLREKTLVEYEHDSCGLILNAAPFMTGSSNLSDEWMMTVWKSLNDAYAAEIKVFDGRVSEYFRSRNPDIHPAGRVFFHLVENRTGDEPFAFLATYSTGIHEKGKSKHMPLKHALSEFGSDTGKLLELLVTVQKAAETSGFIAEILESKEIFYPLRISSTEALTILREIPLYEECGIVCRIPDWWKQRSNSVRVSVSVGDTPVSHLSLNTLLGFRVEISTGGETITVDELKRLLAETEGLALIKNRWVEIDHARLREALELYDEAGSLTATGEISLAEAIRLQMMGGKLINKRLPDEIEVTRGEWLNNVFENLTRPENLPDADCGNNFRTDLRDYQKKGLRWLNYMRTIGLGGCLADDMGLGKTVQVIALLNFMRSAGIPAKTLIVVPASLIGNWMNEISTFAPSLSCSVIHPSHSGASEINAEEINEKGSLFITTYGLISRYKWISEIQWDYLILDEAQAIKNPGTAQTRAVKKIQARNRLVMTGTPIENRLSDLWSIFDFLNPGLLGSAAEFGRYCKKIKDSADGYGLLKQAVSPFILRRMKTDRSIITDLPEKIEMKSYASLTKKQAALYLAVVNDMKHLIETSADGIQRRGIILAAMMKFKQICNHPDQHTGQNVYAEDESGKFARLREICQTIGQRRERALIFTQFREITGPLASFLEEVFGHRGLVLHGDVPVKKRKDLVDQFQGRAYVPFMVLSIKAGGVGLNLTAASHVIHFDRWWNPAVENQATDRAFRIGQKKNVVVHKFVTTGTIEEKIDLMLEEKKAMSRDIISDSQESLITEMSNEELFRLISLN